MFEKENSFLENLNSDIQQGRLDKRPMEDLDVVQALYILKYLRYKSIPDILLATSAFNLLNVWAKGNQERYQFRFHLRRLLRGMAKANQENIIRLNYLKNQDNHEPLLIVQIGVFQFSFHGERDSVYFQRLMDSTLEWDHIRKQPYANEIFHMLLDAPFTYSRCLNNMNLKQELEYASENLKNGNLEYKNGCYYQTGNFSYNNKIRFPVQKTRNELLNHLNQVSIFTGRFVEVHKLIYQNGAEGGHITFSRICPLVNGSRSIVIVEHINLKYRDFVKVASVDILVKNKRYIIIGRIEEYPGKKGERKIGVELDPSLGGIPVYPYEEKDSAEIKKANQNLLDQCYRFDESRYISSKMEYVNLCK